MPTPRRTAAAPARRPAKAARPADKVAAPATAAAGVPSPAAVAAGGTSRKPVGRSLHIGLNSVSPKAYAGWSGELMACEADAIDMTALCKAQGLKPQQILTAKATRARVLAALRAAAKALKAGDLFVLTFSGHGGQVPDTNRDEVDRQDETWCLFDGQLIDDELYLELSRFAAGVRVLVLSDSCHSGTVTRAALPALPAGAGRPRLMPPAVAVRTYAARRTFYDDLQAKVLAAAGGRATLDPDSALALASASLQASSNRITGLPTALAPAVVLISGCQDNQTSMDGEHNGAFTEQVLRVWNHGRFTGSLTQFHARVRAALPPTQSPHLYLLGDAAALVRQRPFTV